MGDLSAVFLHFKGENYVSKSLNQTTESYGKIK
jgi:hypothetical protein